MVNCTIPLQVMPVLSFGSGDFNIHLPTLQKLGLGEKQKLITVDRAYWRKSFE